MKVRVKQTKKKFAMMPCGCCERVYFKEKSLDKQTLKEALEEISNTLDCDDVLTG
ncbi:hypothetical protein [Pseudomonas phage COT4]|uniref:Uncharacterized protein n=1 Tax=Pseudomonas phage M5.1 TaxID=2873460 RepID=A0AAE8XE09_9CAUD|nr:hypothetical protein QGX13_gp171 [Pseudomonas phage M5.1]UAV89653.1 hypothetical protein M51_68 [Pseudomonas phage M5.1]UAV89921.1 hypothetical protein REC_68 [Pseudomonas phage REC]UGL61252.1 hypothetical protein [Pseudomonas phage COT4]UGL62648.1 hypothetical protein [Pseudomonas phage REC1]